MIYAVIAAMFLGSAVLACFIIKSQIPFPWRVLFNVIFLLLSGAFVVLTGLEETSLLVYILLFVLTLLGILTRLAAPPVLNFIGRLLANIQKQEYTNQTYEQLMRDGHRMYFCVWLFATLKVWLYILLGMSLFGWI